SLRFRCRPDRLSTRCSVRPREWQEEPWPKPRREVAFSFYMLLDGSDFKNAARRRAAESPRGGGERALGRASVVGGFTAHEGGRGHSTSEKEHVVRLARGHGGVNAPIPAVKAG